MTNQVQQDLLNAAIKDDVGGLRAALARGVAVDAADHRGRTALYRAVASGSLLAVEYLLALGANPNHADREGQTPFLAAVMANSPQAFVALSRGARPSISLQELLRVALRVPAPRLVPVLIEAGAAPDHPDASASSLRELLAFHSMRRMPGLAEEARVELENDFFEALTALLRHGGRVEVDDLELALRDHPHRVVSTILGFLQPRQLQERPEILHLAAAYAQEPRTLAALLDAGLRGFVDSLDAEGQTPLHVACRGCRGDLIPLLLQAGANPNRRDGRDRSPLHILIETYPHRIASDEQRASALRVLLGGGADAKKRRLREPQGMAPLEAIVRTMTNLLGRDGGDGSETPLELALRLGDSLAIGILFEKTIIR